MKTRGDALQLCRNASDPIVVLPDGETSAGDSKPSTVVDLCGSRPAILRAGAVDRASLERVVGLALEGGSPQ